MLILPVFFFSCEKEIKFNGDEIKNKLVLNGLLSPDSTVKINLTESRFFLDDNEIFKNINNAKVDLWINDNKTSNLSNTGEGNYIGTYILKTGDNIRITASCDGFDPVECSTGIVSPTPIISADTINYKENRSYYYQYEKGTAIIDSSSYYMTINFEMFITLKDPKDISNYYSLNLYLKYYFSNGDSLLLPVRYQSDDLVFQTRNDPAFLDDEDYLKSTVFNDELFNGKEYKLKIKTNSWLGVNVGENPFDPGFVNQEIAGKEIIVELQSLSFGYYMYQKTLEAHSNLNNLMEYFSEPIQIYSNVKGGIGILGSYSNSLYSIPLK